MTSPSAGVVSLPVSSRSPRGQAGGHENVVATHSSEDDYQLFVANLDITADWRHRQLRFRPMFVQRYPDLNAWFDRPLRERVGRRRGEYQNQRRNPADGFDWGAGRINHNARPYLIYLGLTGQLRLDWGWLFGVGVLKPWQIADGLGPASPTSGR